MIKLFNNSNFAANSGCQVIRQYYSRRNQVSKVRVLDDHYSEASIIIKKHVSDRQAEIEFINLQHLIKAEIKVPLPLALDGKYLYLQHLDGILLTDIIENNLISQAVWTDKLACWYYNLHLISAGADGCALLKTDNNLRNFIFINGTFYGLDFEDLSCGDPARDLGQVCAFILADRPAFTGTKKASVSELAQRYYSLNKKVKPGQIEKEALLELKKMIERRKNEEHTIREYLRLLSRGKFKLFTD